MKDAEVGPDLKCEGAFTGACIRFKGAEIGPDLRSKGTEFKPDHWV